MGVVQVQLGSVQMGIVQLGVVQLGVVQMGVDPFATVGESSRRVFGSWPIVVTKPNQIALTHPFNVSILHSIIEVKKGT